MNNKAGCGNLESVQILERQNDSEATPFERTSVGSGEDQMRRFHNFPIMLFDIQANAAVEPAAPNPDRLIYHEC